MLRVAWAGGLSPSVQRGQGLRSTGAGCTELCSLRSPAPHPAPLQTLWSEVALWSQLAQVRALVPGLSLCEGRTPTSWCRWDRPKPAARSSAPAFRGGPRPTTGHLCLPPVAVLPARVKQAGPQQTSPPAGHQLSVSLTVMVTRAPLLLVPARLRGQCSPGGQRGLPAGDVEGGHRGSQGLQAGHGRRGPAEGAEGSNPPRLAQELRAGGGERKGQGSPWGCGTPRRAGGEGPSGRPSSQDRFLEPERRLCTIVSQEGGRGPLPALLGTAKAPQDPGGAAQSRTGAGRLRKACAACPGAVGPEESLSQPSPGWRGSR